MRVSASVNDDLRGTNHLTSSDLVGYLGIALLAQSSLLSITRLEQLVSDGKRV